MSIRSRSNALSLEQSSPPLVAVMVEDSDNLGVLADSGLFTVANQDISAWSESGIDLAILDHTSLLRHEHDVRSLKTLQSQEQIPILLLVSDTSLQTSAPLLGELADELIRTPISEIELRARINSLLRFRNLPDTRNLNIEPSSLELRGVTRALHAFWASNDRTIRAYREKDVLTDLCTSLTHEGGYPLAWVGQRLADNERSIKPIAVSGRRSKLVPPVFPALQQDAISSSPMEEAFETGRVIQIVLPQTAAIGEPGQPVTTGWPGSVIVFPLTRRRGQPSTCLALYNSESKLFDQSEIDLLQRLIDNALRGIDSLREKFRQKRSEREAIRLAYKDSLTGLANRTSLLKALDIRLKRPGPYPPATALLYVDLDSFKLINDALGHDLGDSVLVEVSRRLQSTVRDGDLIARYAGDEFVILVPLDTAPDETPPPSSDAFAAVRALAEEILDALGKPFLIEGRQYRIESSIGIGMCPAHAGEAFSLLMRADSAMYEAKQTGGNSLRFFSSELSQRRQKRQQMENKLYRSVDSRAFEIALQPIVDLSNGDIVGAESLLRWPQSDGTYISPADFIPIAEETGLIITIGDWVMEESLKALQRLRRQGFTNLQVAVNLAIAQLWQTHLVKRTVSLLRALDIPASALKVELTEGSLMQDVERMEEVVREFREAGISVAIDDFGTGYSALARLKSLPITTLKIDRSFLNGVPGEDNAVSVVTTIVHMAQNLGIKSIAEGIETEDQWQILRELGCPFGQGFYFARPMPEKDLLNLLQKQTGVSQQAP